MATIYKILSPCLKECYVGSTTRDANVRWLDHKIADRNGCNHCRSRILFEKYGMDNCKFVVLEVCPLEERFIKEQWWMDHSVGLVNYKDAIASKDTIKAYRETHAEEIRIQRKAYNDAHARENLEYSRRYNETHKDIRQAYANSEERKEKLRVWNEANKERVIAYKKAYYQANREKILAQTKARYAVKKSE